MVLIESTVYGLAAIGALFAMRAAGVERPILLAFFVPVLPLACGVSWYIFRHVIPGDLALGVTRRKIDVRRESPLIIGDFFMSTIELLVRALTPVLVADWLGTDIAAGYAVAAAIGFAMGDLFTAIQRSLATELSRHPEQRRSLVRRTLKLIAVGVVPSALAVAVAAPLVLRLFGKDFVEASSFLRLSGAVGDSRQSRERGADRRSIGALDQDDGGFTDDLAHTDDRGDPPLPARSRIGRHRSGLRHRLDCGTLSRVVLYGPAPRPAVEPGSRSGAWPSRTSKILRMRSLYDDDDAALADTLAFAALALGDDEVDAEDIGIDYGDEESRSRTRCSGGGRVRGRCRRRRRQGRARRRRGRYGDDVGVEYGDDDVAFEHAVVEEEVEFDDDVALDDNGLVYSDADVELDDEPLEVEDDAVALDDGLERRVLPPTKPRRWGQSLARPWRGFAVAGPRFGRRDSRLLPPHRSYP